MSTNESINDPNKEQLRQQLLAQLAELDAIATSTNGMETIISSPAIQPQLHESQPIAFIHSRQDVIPGIITSINSDETYDLQVYVPTGVTKIEWKSQKTAFDRAETIELISQPRSRARLSDPRLIFRKETRPLAKPQGGDGINQTDYDIFTPMERKLPVPRFHDFHTSLIGTFFDPSIYIYNVLCFRAARVVDNQRFPEERILYPKKKSSYEDFAKAFNRYFKEYHLGRSRLGSKWDSVQIQVQLKA